MVEVHVDIPQKDMSRRAFRIQLLRQMRFIISEKFAALLILHCLPLKMDGWNTILSYWGPGLFSGDMLVSGRVTLIWLMDNFSFYDTNLIFFW